MALGAQRGTVLKLVLMQGMRLAAIGIVVGIVFAAFLGRLFTSLLFQVSVLHVLPWLCAAVLLMSVVLVASFLPARRAASIEPMKALRTE
jgi:putative ABC transport system permease protein